MSDTNRISMLEGTVAILSQFDADALKVLKNLRSENQELKLENERLSQKIIDLDIDFDIRITKMERKFYSML